MIFWSFRVVVVTALLGLALVLLYGLGRRRGLALIGPLHGILGITGFALLLLALRGPVRGVAYGAGSFGMMAAVLLAGAIPAGLLVRRTRLRARDPILVIGLHVTLAIFGLVLLAAYATVPA